jgi:uncharacterized protein (DUF2225 family)
MKLKQRLNKLKSMYEKSKSAQVGFDCICPSCSTTFKKENYQQAFCKTKGGTICKDYYWNNVTPNKRNNKTRISPANASFMADKQNYEDHKTIFDRAFYSFDEGWDGHKDTF